MRAALAALLLALAGCAQAPQSDHPGPRGPDTTTEAIAEQRAALVGKWFRSHASKDGGTRQDLAELSRNGTYVWRARTVDGAGAEAQWSEIGEWGVVGAVHFTITKGWLENDAFQPADPNSAKHYSVYRVLKLTADEFTYQHIVTKDKFTLKRVNNDFQFPK